MRLADGSKFELSLMLVCLMGDVDRRLVKYHVLQPRFKIFEHHSPFLPAPRALQDYVESCSQQAVDCDQCVDKVSTLPFLRLGAENLRELNSILGSLAVTAGVSSSIVEKVHLIGEEKKAPRARGRAIAAERLSEETYQATVVLESHRLADRVRKKVRCSLTPRTIVGLSLSPGQQTDQDTGAVCMRVHQKRSTE